MYACVCVRVCVCVCVCVRMCVCGWVGTCVCITLLINCMGVLISIYTYICGYVDSRSAYSVDGWMDGWTRQEKLYIA